MSGDDLFRKYQEVGAEFLEATRARAEELFTEIMRLGDVTQRQAHELREDGFKVTDTVVNGLRRELSRQLEQLGFLTNVDTERVDHLLDAIERSTRGLLNAALPFGAGEREAGELGSAAKEKSPAKKATAKKSTTKKAAPKKAPAKKAAAKKSPAKKGAAKKAPAKKATPPTGPTSTPGGTEPPTAPGS